MDGMLSGSGVTTMSQAVVVVIEGMKPGTRFHGNELHKRVRKVFPPARKMYTDTVLRMMRRHCSGLYRTVDHNKSLYERAKNDC